MLNKMATFAISIMRLIIMLAIVHGSTCMPEHCPVDLQTADITGYCECSSGQRLQITCHDLDAIPLFIPDGKTYREISMKNQNIQWIPDAAFSGLRVEYVDLTSNPIRDRISSKALHGMEDFLEELRLNDCGIESLPAGLLKGMGELVVLELEDNFINEIPNDYFSETRKLLTMDLGGNRIASFNNQTVRGISSLIILRLDRNRIRTISQNTLRSLRELIYLYLDHNNIKHIQSNTFLYNKDLTHLKLNNNGLTYLHDGAFNGLESLRYLYLQNNNITQLDGYLFGDLSNLTSLDLNNNSLEYVGNNDFKGLHKLEFLFLKNNQIRIIGDAVFDHAHKLTHLNIAHNRLETLHGCSLAESLEWLTFIDNPLVCDCQLSWIALGDIFVEGNCAVSPLNITLISQVYDIYQCPDMCFE